MNPKCCIDDFVQDYLEEATELLDHGRVCTYISSSGSPFGEWLIHRWRDVDSEINSMIAAILNEWWHDQSDIGISFYSPVFNHTSELVQHALS